MTVFDLQAILRLDKSQYEQGLNMAEAESNSLGGKLAKGLGVMAGLATAAVAATGAAAVGFAKDSVAVGMEFDKSMSQVAATMGKTVEEIDELREFAQEMGRTTAFSATQAADALNYMALAGYDTQESMEMLPNVLNLAAAGNFDLARASDMVTDTQTAFGISAERTTQLVDEMAKAASTGNTSVEQLGDAFLTVGGLAQELNGGFVTLANGTQAPVDGIQELEIALTAMANAGVKGSEAGTHMRNMLLKLSSPTDDGVLRLNQLGVAAFDTEGKMRSLSDIFGELGVALGDLTQEEKIQAISDLFNTRDLASAEALLNAVSQDWDSIGEAILEAEGAAQKMADTQLDNLAGDVTLFKSALEGAKISISDSLTPALRQFVQFGTSAVSDITNAFQNEGFAGAMETLADYLSDGVEMVSDYLPEFVDGITSIVSEVVPTMIKVLVRQAPEMINSIVGMLGDMLPGIASAFGELLLNLPAMLVNVAGGLVNGLVGFIGGIIDAVKEQAENSVPDDLAEGYVGKIQSNFEKSLSDGMTNLKLAVSNLIGNEEWSEALENLQLAKELQDKIISDYSSAKENISQYSFENFQVATEADINTAMTLFGALTGSIDENGNITGDLGVVQSYIDQINKILGDGAVTLDETPADWIIQIAEQYKDADGNITDPETVRSEIETGLNEIFGGGEAIDLAEQTYNAVSKVLSGYTEEQAIADKDAIGAEIQDLLDQAGVPTEEIETIVDALINQGGMDIWYNTGASTSWDNSSFIEWLQKNSYLPTEENPAETEAIAEILTKFVSGTIDREELDAELEKFQLTDEQKNQILSYSFDEEKFNQTIANFKELQNQMFQTSLLQAFTEASVENTRNFMDAVSAAKTAQENFNSSASDFSLEAMNEQLNNATLALNAQEAEARLTYDSLFDLLGGEDTLKASREEYIESMLEQNQVYQNQREELDNLRASEADAALELINMSGGYDKLSDSSKEIVNNLLISTNSVENFGKMLGLTSEQTGILAEAIDGYFDEYGAGAQGAQQGIWLWAQTSEEALGIAESLGISTSDLASLLYMLADNENLLTESTDNMSEAMDGAGSSASDASDDISDAVDSIKDSADGMGEAGKSMQEVFLEEMGKVSLGMTRIGHTASSNFSGSVLAGQPTAVQKAGMFINGTMNAMVAAINARQPDVEGAVGEVESGAEGAMSPLMQNMTDTGDTSASNLDESFGAWATTIGQTVTGIYNLFQNTFGTLPDQMSVWGAQVGDYFYLAFSNSDASSVISDAEDIASGMVSAVSGLSDSMYWQFYYAGQGAYNGFTAWATPLINAAKNTADRLIAETARGLDNNSPSKKMREQYGYAGEGAYLGWLDWGDKIVDAAEGTADDVVDSLDYSPDYASAGVFDYANKKSNIVISDSQEQILNLLMIYLPQLLNRDVVLDSGKTVGSFMPIINAKMDADMDMARRNVNA